MPKKKVLFLKSDDKKCRLICAGTPDVSKELDRKRYLFPAINFRTFLRKEKAVNVIQLVAS